MSTVLEPFLNTFRTADKHPDITQRVLGDREILRRTYPELKAKIEEKDAAVDEARKLGTDSPQYKQARAEREAWERNKRAALVHIGAELLWERYKTARVAALFALFLVFAGVVAFAWGANPPDDQKEAPPVVLGQAPLLLDVTLTSKGVAALRAKRTSATSSTRRPTRIHVSGSMFHRIQSLHLAAGSLGCVEDVLRYSLVRRFGTRDTRRQEPKGRTGVGRSTESGCGGRLGKAGA